MKVKRILCPTDFSDASSAALGAAIDLAKEFGASLMLFHAHAVPAYMFPDGMMPVTPQALSELERSIEAELRRLAARAEAAGIAVETRHAIGVAWSEICRVADELSADMIVLGTHGRTGLRHVPLGSTAEKVVRHAKCPVVTVRSTPTVEAHP
jgi:nucleotide-binding universal stress UspA family protein